MDILATILYLGEKGKMTYGEGREMTVWPAVKMPIGFALKQEMIFYWEVEEMIFYKAVTGMTL